VAGEPTERRSKMGICDCGKETVWNDMCEDCNIEYDSKIYSLDTYGYNRSKPYAQIYQEEEEAKTEPFFSSDILNIHILLKQVAGVSSLDMTGSHFDMYLVSGGKTRVETRRDMHDYNTIMNEHQGMIDALKMVYR
jgi:hypothetical protein